MAEQEASHSLASAFPSPPPFWRDFTDDNVRRMDELLAAAAGEGQKAPMMLDDVSPKELANLRPPPEPTDRRWRVFGDHYTLDDELPTLEDQGITNLPVTHPSRQQQQPSTQTASITTTTIVQHHDTALELKRLTKSLLLNFLELVGTLTISPSDAAAKVADVRTHLINIHHTLNRYRPHQARESAAELIQDLLDRTRRETAGVQEVVDRGRRVLEGLGSLGVDDGAGGGEEEDDGGVGGEVVEEEAIQGVAWGLARERDLWRITDGVLAIRTVE